MSHRSARLPAGFSIPELLIVMVVCGIIAASFFTFFDTSLKRYLALQQDGTSFAELASQSQRVAGVLRGLTNITEASNTDITIYAYFSPEDTYVSLVHYYQNGAGTVLYADVTPMTANPPIGTPITAEKQTYTIISSLYTTPGVPMFVYLDAGNNILSIPISDLNTIKVIKINLAIPVASSSTPGDNDALTLQVSLRNRKTNL